MKFKPFILPALALSLLVTGLQCSAQDALGTFFGIPGVSASTAWPRGGSVQSLGGFRLYPDGPEFGLSNTSGGFGRVGSGMLTGVGLTTNTTSNLVKEELARPYASAARLSGMLNLESQRSSAIFTSAIGSQTQSEGFENLSYGQIQSRLYAKQSSTYLLPSADSILKDRPQSPDSILKTGL